MKFLKPYNIFESRFLEFREVISTIKDICLEFEDNNCHYKITPDDEIHLNIVSLKSRGLLGRINQPFFLEIDIDRRIINQDNKRSGFGNFPKWFIETCQRIEEFMNSVGFITYVSVRYPTDWVNLDIDELEEQTGLIQKVKLEFKPYAVSYDI